MIEARAGQKHRAGVDAVAGDVGIENIARADDHVRRALDQVGNYVEGSGNGHGDLNDRDAAARDGFSGEHRFVRRAEAHRRDDTDFFDPRANLFFLHEGESLRPSPPAESLCRRFYRKSNGG